MYDNDNVTYKVGINWKDIIIKVIILALFILLLLWLFPKANLDVFYDSIYSENIKTMKDAARNYYTVDRLPANVGDQTSMTLKEMIDNKMLIRFTDKDGQTCDETTSKVEVTKIADDEYTLKVQLNCGEQQDYILETIGCTTVCSNGTCTTVINNGDNSSTIANNNNNHSNNTTGISNDNDDSVTERVDSDGTETGSVKDDIYTVKTILYQHKKAIVTTKTVYTCPSGYTKNGTKCIKKTTGATIDATPVYNPDQVITTDAKYNYTGDYTVSADPIKKEVGTDYTCPTGYTLNGAYCIKYTNATEHKGETTYTCPSGYTKNGTKCVKTYDATKKTGSGSYSCPSGGTLSGSKCTITSNASASTSYTCPSGYTRNGTSCYKVYTASGSTTYSCPSGYTRSGSTCSKTTSVAATAHTSYGGWVNRGTKYYTSSSKAYTGTTSKLVLQGAISGATCGSPCGNKGIWYKYIYYTRSQSTSYTCPSGYSRSGSTCYKTTTISATANTKYSCPSGGSLSGNKCTITSSATANTTYSCPSGYSKNGTKCTKTYNATYNSGSTSYTCPNGGTLSGTKCTITKDATASTGQTTYTCPSGYTYNSSTKKCEMKISATATKKYSYSCPTGYTASGEGENMKCTKTVKGENKYYCEDSDAVLNGTKCIKTVKGDIKNYTCPNGYTLSGEKCIKQTTVTIDATVSTKKSTSYQYKWSEKSYLEGWTFTGKTKTSTKTYTAGQR